MWSLYIEYLNYLLLREGMALHFNKLNSPSLNDTLCQVWFKFAQWFWGRSRNVKILRTDRQTEARQKVIKKVHFDFQLT